MIDLNSDERYMRMALTEARAAYSKGEVPIGAVVVSPRVAFSAADTTTPKP